MNNNKPWWRFLLDIVTIIASMAVLFIVINYIPINFDRDNDIPNEIETPANETPKEPIDVEPLPEIHKTSLLSTPYFPSANPYGSSYQSEAIRLTIGGEFASAKLKIRGETIGEGLRFLSLNFGEESGIFNASRRSANKLDVKETIELGGAFSSKNPINLEIDLLNPITLAPIGSESLEGGNEQVALWEQMRIAPPTVTYLLVAPFTESGSYGGAKLESMEIDYICKEKSDCKIKICPTGTLTTQCLLDTLGEEAMKSWCERSKRC